MIRTFASTILALGIATAAASGQTYSNAGTITIPDSGNATPYPSTIGVVGGPLSISTMSVRLNNVSHTYASDIDVLLVGPGGQTVVLFSDVGGGENLVNDTFTFTSIAGAPAAGSGGVVSGGTYAPTNVGTTDAFGAPAPAGPYGADFSAFLGTNPNGTWSLYVVDDVGADQGTIGGWTLILNEVGTPGLQPTSNVFTYQGKLTSGGTSVNGNVDVRFSFWRDASSTTTGAAFGPVITNSNVAVTDGLFTTLVDAGDAFFDNHELWAEIAVRNPAGAGAFTPLSGRQRLTPAPSAQWASNSLNAVTLQSPDRSDNLVNTDNNGNIGIGRPAGQIGGGTVVIEGRTGTGVNSFGGMYVNTPNANSWPFMGFSTAGNIQSYWWHDPTDGGIRFSNGTYMRNSGAMGVGGAPVAGFTLSVNGALRCVGFTNASSQRYKTDVHSVDAVLDRFTQLRPVTFVWNDEAPRDVRGQKTTGLIAEEVYRLFPEAVSLDAAGRPDGIDYSRVTALSIQALKEMHAQQAAKDAELDALKARLEAIEKALNK